MERAPMFPVGFSKPASDVFPVSIKGVLYEGGRVVLLENERGEWELPGGRLEAGEAPESCLAREVEEELGIAPEIGPLLDCWVYEVLPKREVLIVTYGLHRRDRSALRVSAEHRRIGLFSLDRIDRIRLPRGYHRAVRAWGAAQWPATTLLIAARAVAPAHLTGVHLCWAHASFLVGVTIEAG